MSSSGQDANWHGRAHFAGSLLRFSSERTDVSSRCKSGVESSRSETVFADMGSERMLYLQPLLTQET